MKYENSNKKYENSTNIYLKPIKNRTGNERETIQTKIQIFPQKKNKNTEFF
jgi:hypothetical protein